MVCLHYIWGEIRLAYLQLLGACVLCIQMNNNVLFSLGRQQATTDAFERHVNKLVHKNKIKV